MIKLLPGEYLSQILRRRNLFGLPLTLTTYQLGQVYPWHIHEFPTLFVLFAGEHRDPTRTVSYSQPPLSVVFHPTTGPHETTVGARGLIGLNAYCRRLTSLVKRLRPKGRRQSWSCSVAVR
jgi:hypothetical protein